MKEYRFDRQPFRLGLFGLLMAAAFIGGVMVLLAVKYTGLGQALVINQPPSQEESVPSREPAESRIITDYETATIKVVEKVGPAVVMITTTKLLEVNDFFFGLVGYREVQGLGSGVIFQKDGYILTNNHVISKAETILAVLSDGRSFSAKVIGSDPYTDLAVLKIEGKDLPTVDFGDSDKLSVGQTAIAIGNPIGEGLKNTVTVGVISALRRTLKIEANISLRDLIQTDASINPGNSGGPLLNSAGKVIGINTAIIQEAQGIGFAIPINKASEVASLLIKEGRVRRGTIGITYIPYDRSNRRLVESKFRIQLPREDGFLITSVVSNGPAAKAGIKPGDVVVKINETSLAEGANFQGLDLRVGDRVVIEIIREKKSRTIEVVAAESR